MRLPLLGLAVFALVIAGCASGGIANQARDPMLVILGNGSSVRYSRDVHVVTADVVGSTASLWPELKAAYAALGLPVTLVDSANRLIGAQNAELNGRFQNAPVARVVDCGQTTLGRRARMPIACG